MKGCLAFPPFLLETGEMKKICKYCKRRGQEFRPHDIVRDFCPDALFVAYPYALALLYGAEGECQKGRVHLRCPHPQGIVMEVRRVHCRPLWLRLLKRLFDWVVARVLYPVDWEDWHIRVRVLENRGACPANYVPGTTYWLNVRRTDELCPAAFHGIYPFVLADHGAGAEERSIPRRLHCPDHEGIIYNLQWLADPPISS